MDQTVSCGPLRGGARYKCCARKRKSVRIVQENAFLGRGILSVTVSLNLCLFLLISQSLPVLAQGYSRGQTSDNKWLKVAKSDEEVPAGERIIAKRSTGNQFIQDNNSAVVVASSASDEQGTSRLAKRSPEDEEKFSKGSAKTFRNARRKLATVSHLLGGRNSSSSPSSDNSDGGKLTPEVNWTPDD